MKPRKNRAGGKTVYDDSLKIAVARDYLTGNLSYSQVAEKYGITGGREVVNGFIRWYKKHYDLHLSKTKTSTSETHHPSVTSGKTIKQLQQELADANLKIAALEIMIQIAEKELSIDIRKKAWHQTVVQMKGYYPSVGFAKLCGLFGKTRQAVYDITWRQTDELLKEDLILHLVGDIRADLPKIGGVKLYYLLQEKIAAHGIKIGRDSFFDLLRANNLLIKRKRKYVVTTLSRHKFKIWPNLIEALIVNRPEQLWVSDITYLRTKAGFVYLFLITDAYSRKIMGYHLSQGLKVKGCIIALNKAITSRYYPGRALIHHSDRGIQYCCNSYVSLLKQENLQISMTQTGSPYDNAIAERINGILKTELGLDQVFESYNSAVEPIAKSIHAYNNLRPHMSCDFLTPEQAHQREGSLKKHWKKIIHHQDRQFLQHQ